jgi:hypothetical protein
MDRSLSLTKPQTPKKRSVREFLFAVRIFATGPRISTIKKTMEVFGPWHLVSRQRSCWNLQSLFVESWGGIESESKEPT